ncbi:hypothetical protein Cni_G14485 [Canna indica]|uniref:Uncharacterized protein n=1 Tax=Canna indica TaxID=4628 RepID=A0AAQ3KBR9_9LILI|nr:hypothetical protein Cni_G14485 [Canna indica]
MVATTSNGGGSDEPQRHLQSEIRDMLSTLTGRLAAMGRSMARSDVGKTPHEGGGGGGGGTDADHGFGIITLAGDNKGASMKANMEDLMDTHGGMYDEESGMCTHTNSNYQAVNNSILLGGSCSADDPGVHVVISEYIEDEDDDEDEEEQDKKDKKEKKKGKEKKKKKDEKENKDAN